MPGLPSDQTQIPPSQDTSAPPPEGGEAQDQGGEFVNFLLTDLDGFWTEQFQGSGRELSPPGLVLFTNAVPSGCGQASSATGPFYCPLDQKAYVDLTFFRELEQALQAPGDFAQAYVLAHEYGHHVQNQLGIEQKVRDRASRTPTTPTSSRSGWSCRPTASRASGAVRSTTAGILEDGDLEEGITAAEAVGDDRIQEQTQGRIDPEIVHPRHLRAAREVVPQRASTRATSSSATRSRRRV